MTELSITLNLKHISDYGDDDLTLLLDHFCNIIEAAGVKADEAEVEGNMMK